MADPSGNVPDDVRDDLAARAARSGRSLQEYLVGQLVELAPRPDVGTVLKTREHVCAAGSSLTTAQILVARDADRS